MKEINEYKAEQIQGQYIRLNANESNSIFSKGEILDMLLSLQLDNFNRYPDTSTKELRKAYGKFIGYSYKNILPAVFCRQTIIIKLFIFPIF